MFRQIAAVTTMSVRSIPQRLGTSLVIVIGIAGVVGVVVSVITMASGLEGALLSTGSEGRAIVLRGDATAEMTSSLSMAAVSTIADAPGIARLASGGGAVTADLLVPVNLNRKEGGALAPLLVRGISDATLTVRPEIKLVAGRMFEPGLHEVIVGRNSQLEIAGLEIGDRVPMRESQWLVVGTFASGTVHESGMLTDLSTLQSTYQRPAVHSVTALLESPAAFEDFKAALTTDPTLSVDVVREPEYFERQSENLGDLMFLVTYVVGVIMAVGAFFGALNTMYSAVSTRGAEIATLRAIGFGAGGVVVSVLAEALLLAVFGGAIGAFAAWLLFSGNTIALGGQLGSLVTELRVTPAVLGIGLAWAAIVGLLGGLPPAVRAARLPVATALRAV
jgi:putative ABC transport system permease protein